VIEHSAARRLHIAVVASWYPTTREPLGGIFVRDQASVLAERYDVTLIAPRLTMVSRRPATWSSLVPSLRNAAAEAASDDDVVPTIRPRAISVRRAPWLSERSYERAILRGLRDRRERDRPDILHAHVVLPAGLAAVHVGRLLGIPVVLTEHSSPFSVHLASDRMRSRVVEALRGASRVVAVGEGLRAEIRRVAPVPVDVLGNVIAPAFFAQPPHPVRLHRPLRLLGVGFLVPQKRFDLLLDAVARIPPDRLLLDVIIVGDGPEEGALRAQASRLGLAYRARFVPMGPRTELVRWLEWCDVIVSSSDHESFGLVIAEALATGRPVVATASGGPEGFVDPDIGFLVRRDDPDALAAAICDLPRFLAGFDPAVARGRMADRFGPKSFLDRIAALYEEITASGHGAEQRARSQSRSTP
jgi:glycosyltransferase involved in cell wall biosynthesis